MADSDLIFGLPYDGSLPAPLVFGEDSVAPIPDAPFSVVGRLPTLRGRAALAVVRGFAVRGRMPALGGRVRTTYVSGASRPTVNDTTSSFQQAAPTNESVRARWQESQTWLDEVRGVFESAQPISTQHRTTWLDSDRVRQDTAARFQEAQRLGVAPIRVPYQDGVRLRNALRQWFQEAERLTIPVTRAQYQDAYRDRRNFTAARFQQASPYSVAWTEHGGYGVPLNRLWVSKYQEAMRPPVGKWVPPGPQPEDPCYIPGLPAPLVFINPWTGSPNLIFVCDRHDPGPEPGETIVVPVKEVYLTINSAVLVRLDNGNYIPATAMSMSLDVDSWTWSFSASVPGAALDQVKPNSNGDLVLVQATINGVPYRFAIEKISRERAFNSSELRVSGRGIAAELDAPYAAQMSFGNTQPRNMRQLLDDILLVNNVPIGWDIGLFEPEDWAVPAGVFSHVGTHISAMNAVVGAAGAYLQPHNTARTMDVRLRYPVPAWQWGSVTPQFELPAAVTTQEGFEWTDKPKYNRVFVSGQEGGVLGQYTRTGTAGDLVAPSVVDPLITQAVAARQRGRAIISDTGRIATVTLRLPVLAETGIIKPGNFVHYKEGGNTHIGLTRGVSVAVGLPTIYQTLTVETHVEPV